MAIVVTCAERCKVASARGSAGETLRGAREGAWPECQESPPNAHPDILIGLPT